MKNFPSLHSLIMIPDNDLSFHKDQLAHVLRIPHGYICGMCGKQYTSLSLAWECVTNDTLKFSSFPVTEVNNHEGCTIHCLLCGKNYVNAEDAALCTSHDLQHTELPLILSEHLNALVIDTLKGQKVTKREPLNSRQSSVGMKINHDFASTSSRGKAAGSIQAPLDPAVKPRGDILEKLPIEAPPIREAVLPEKEQEDMEHEHDVLVIQNSNSDLTSDITSTPNMNAIPPSQEFSENFSIGDDASQEIEKERIHKEKTAITRSPNQTPFVEQDGVYLCNVCMEKYSKKEDVEAHFLQHPLENNDD